jgi:hypothetical protein
MSSSIQSVFFIGADFDLCSWKNNRTLNRLEIWKHLEKLKLTAIEFRQRIKDEGVGLLQSEEEHFVQDDVEPLFLFFVFVFCLRSFFSKETNLKIHLTL